MRPDRQFFGGLESLRGVAAVLVIFHHMTQWPSSVLRASFFQNGYLMVDLFFVLSGFVICHSYAGAELSTGRGLARFMLVRFGRLYPLHLYLLVLFLAIETAKYLAETKLGFVARVSRAFSLNDTPAFIANLFLVHPFFRGTNVTFNHASWSIGVEFYTYLLFGLLFFWLPKRSWLAPVAWVLALLAFGLLWGAGGHCLTPDAGLCFLRCLVGFFLGVAAHELYQARPRWLGRRDWRREAAVLAVLAGILVGKPPQSPGWDFVVLPLFMLLILSVADASGGVWNWPPLRWLGKVSYSLYLVHLAVLMLVSRLAEALEHGLLAGFSSLAAHGAALHAGLTLVFVLTSLAAVFGLSHLTYRWIEVPYQQYFRRLAASRLPPAAP